MRYFMIDEDQVRALERVRTRLHSERRMDGDEMRDMGHELAVIARVVRELEVPDEPPKGHAVTQPSPLPTTLAAGTVFRITWPTGKTGLRETYGEARLVGDVYIDGEGGGPHGHTIQPEQIVWDEAEATECKRKIRIAEEVR